MPLLSCGGSDLPATPRPSVVAEAAAAVVAATKPRAGYETFQERCASMTDAQKRLSTGVDGRQAKLEASLSHYESMLAQVRPLDKMETTPPKLPMTLMEIARLPGPQTLEKKKRRSLALPTPPSPDLDEIALPDMHEGLYRTFCPPNSWCPAFASPGDFTIKMEAVFQDSSEVFYRIAVMCCCARSILDSTRVRPASKRQYYVNHIERSEKELVRLAETLSLQYLGHRLADTLPKHTSRISGKRKQRELDAYGEEVIRFLSYLLQITEVGFNGLVAVTEPVVNNVRLREFLDLAFGFGDQTIAATSSCDARIEGQEGGNRPVLPRAWMDVDSSQQTDATYYLRAYGIRRSPQHDAMSRAFSRRSENGLLSDLSDAPYRSHSHQFQSTSSTQRSSTSKCTRFVTPARWFEDSPSDGAFTVEISSVTVGEGAAQYSISVLYYVGDRLEVAAVDRRYSEFDDLALKLEAKVPSLKVRQLLPPKTFFRYLSASFLERRAAHLQRFLERALRMSFQGVLDQDIPLTAEPNVREFLKLPSVEWSVVPWHRLSPRTRSTQDRYRLHPSYSMSPTTAAEFSPGYTPTPTLPRGSSYGQFQKPPAIEHSYESFSLKKSDSL